MLITISIVIQVTACHVLEKVWPDLGFHLCMDGMGLVSYGIFLIVAVWVRI